MKQHALQTLLCKIKDCRYCESMLPHEPRPVVRASNTSRLLIIGQAPGSKVHQTGIPWNDPSGVRLRQWLNMDEDAFYDTSKVALIPMGFCYPGKGKSGDLPPRPECAPLWHPSLINHLPPQRLTLLIGQYAQNYYLGKRRRKNLTETVQAYKDYLPDYLPLPHPSPRNLLWLKKNPWFEKHLIPQLQIIVRGLGL